MHAHCKLVTIHQDNYIHKNYGSACIVIMCLSHCVTLCHYALSLHVYTCYGWNGASPLFPFQPNSVSIILAPRAGHHLGGTTVKISGACLEPTDKISCIFHDTEVEGFVISERVAACISPQIPRFGRVLFQLRVKNAAGSIRTQGRENFSLRE